jgi:Flp pilus assembly protein TadG
MRRAWRFRDYLCKTDSQRGQSLLAFIILFPIFVICLFIVTDLGRLLYLKNQVRIAADSAALAAAGALDMTEAAEFENFIINPVWANKRATNTIIEMRSRIDEDAWMTYNITSLSINDNEVTVVVTGSGSTLFGGYLGIGEFSASAVSHARATVGVDREW